MSTITEKFFKKLKKEKLNPEEIVHSPSQILFLFLGFQLQAAPQFALPTSKFHILSPGSYPRHAVLQTFTGTFRMDRLVLADENNNTFHLFIQQIYIEHPL